jgi:hypothetical protein
MKRTGFVIHSTRLAAALRTAADGIAKIEHEIQIPRALILWLVPQLRLTELGREIAEWFRED